MCICNALLVTYVTYQTGYVVAAKYIHVQCTTTTQENQEGTEVQRTNIIFFCFPPETLI